MKKYLAIVLMIIAAQILSAEIPEDLSDMMINAGFGVASEPFDPVEISLEDLSGKSKSLKDYEGKVIILNFWATWCPPCRSEMPSMQKLYEKYKDKGLEILAIDLRESQKTVSKFIEKAKYTFPVLLDKDGKIGSIYDARNIPTTYLIDTSGKIIGRVVGAMEWDNQAVYTILDKLLEKRK